MEPITPNQRVKSTGGRNFLECTASIIEITNEQNAEGFELTAVNTQSMNNNPEAVTVAILVFTKK